MTTKNINTTTTTRSSRIAAQITAASKSLVSGAYSENRVSKHLGTSTTITTQPAAVRPFTQPQAEVKVRKVTGVRKSPIAAKLAQAKDSLEEGTVDNWTGMKFTSPSAF